MPELTRVDPEIAMIADTFITATFGPGRSPCASAIRTTPTNGNGFVRFNAKAGSRG
jgi:hypothetical protein